MSFLEINLKKLTHNYKYLRSLLDPNVRMMGVIKANAYGSLIEVIANKLIALGIEALAVAYVSEGV
ncbi:MAG: alanine racemase, partial [Flavobacteriaceae bacterium]